MNKRLQTFAWKVNYRVLSATSIFVAPTRFANLVLGVHFALCSMLSFESYAQTAKVQLIHAAEGESLDLVDVYVNQVLMINDLSRNSASPFIQIDFPLQITLAPAASTSAGDGFFTQSVTAPLGDLTTISFIGNPLSASAPLQFLTHGAQLVASDSSKTAVSFLHAATKAMALDAVFREGGMLFGGLGYGQATPYLNLKPDDLFVDLKLSGTSNILSTYRLSTAPYKGQAFRVFATGDMSSASSLRMFAVYSDGFVTPVDFAPVARVQYLNALADTVDVYKNGTKFSNDATPGAAMPYKYIPAGLLMNISVSSYTSTTGLNPYGKFAFTFENLKTYTAVSAGIRDDAVHPLQMFFHDGSREMALDTSKVSLLFFQGNPDWPIADIRLSQTNDLFSAVSYGDFKGYQHLTAVGQMKIRVYQFGTMNMLTEFAPMDLAPYRGQALTLFTKRGAQPGSAELWAARTDGSTFQVAQTVGASEVVESTVMVQLFPNPSHSELNVSVLGAKGNELKCRVLDAHGKVLRESIEVMTGHDGNFRLDVSALPAGLYFLEISTSSGSCAVRFGKM